MNHKIYHYLPCFIISFLVALLLIALQLSYVVTHILLKPSLYSESLADNNISAVVVEDLNTYFTRISATTDIPADVYMQNISKADISQSANDLITDSLAYLTDENAPLPTVKYDFEPLNAGITQYFETYAEENNIEKDDTYDKVLNSTIETAETQIEGKIDVLFLGQISQTSIAQKLHRYAGLLNSMVYICAVAIVILLIIMAVIIRHHKFNMFYWTGCSVFASSLVYLIPCVYLKETNAFGNFFIKTEYIKQAVTGLINSVLSKVITFNILMAVIGLFLICACAIFKSDILSLKKEIKTK